MKNVLTVFLFAMALTASAADRFDTTLLNVSPAGTDVRVAVGDVDHDGKNELVVISPAGPSPQGPARIYSIDRDGTPHLKYSVPLIPSAPGNWSYTQPRIVDVDGDGDLDIALYLRNNNSRGILELLTWDQTRARFITSFYFMPETDAAYGFDMADVDGDGLPDAITADHGFSAPSAVYVSYNSRGPDRFTRFTKLPGLPQRGIVYVYGRDLDGDGDNDLAVSTHPDNAVATRIYWNNGGAFTPQDVPGAVSIDLGIGDADGDGHVDILANGDRTPDLRLFRGPSFATAQTIAAPVDPRTPVFGDFNGDGRNDFATANTASKTISVFLAGAAPVTLNTPELSAADFYTGGYTQELTVGDVDNDGRPDILFATDRVVWIHNGADTTPPSITGISATPNVLTPPNHKMIAVQVRATAVDDVDPAPSVKIVSVSSNEPGPAQWEITGPLTLNLRAERTGKGGDRIYTITVEARDQSGNASTATVKVIVPHDAR